MQDTITERQTSPENRELCERPFRQAPPPREDGAFFLALPIRPTPDAADALLPWKHFVGAATISGLFGASPRRRHP